MTIYTRNEKDYIHMHDNTLIYIQIRIGSIITFVTFLVC